MAILISGCGSDNPPPVELNTTPPIQASPGSFAGLYSGEIMPEGSINPIAVDVMISPDGKMRGISESFFQLSGELVFDGATIETDKLVNYAPQGRDDGIFFGEAIQEGSLSGSLDNSMLTGNSYYADNENPFSVKKRSVSTDGDIQAIEGSYVDSTSSVEVSIDEDGVVSGIDSYGCLYSGMVTMTESASNIYDINLTTENCNEFSAQLSGLLAFLPANTLTNQARDWLMIAVNNATLSMTTILLRN